MLVEITPDPIEIARRKAVALQHKFEYDSQDTPELILETGIYRCAFDHNFCEEEFIEKLDGWNINKELMSQSPLPDDFNEHYINQYGVADNVEQIKEFYAKQIADPDNAYVIAVTPVFQDLENKWKGGGWRWSKWGEYIGKLEPQCEYLDDEDFGPDFKYILCFHLYKVIKK